MISSIKSSLTVKIIATASGDYLGEILARVTELMGNSNSPLPIIKTKKDSGNAQMT
jgi:hypothetical protein